MNERRDDHNPDGFDLSDEEDPLSQRQLSHERGFSGSDTPLVSQPVRPGTPRRQSSVARRRKYDDMAAIDWTEEFAKQREYKEAIRKLGPWRRLCESSHVWLVLLMTGITIGVVAAIIDVVSLWLSGLRLGRCRKGFYLSRTFCCPGANYGESCGDWVEWTSAIDSGFLRYVLSWFISVSLSTLLASLAAWLTLRYAKYARMSGMPEIKTMLGGYVMKGFLGFRTLGVKAIGLCLIVGSGVWVGKEGPLIHLACCCANLAMKPFKDIKQNEVSKREVLSAAAAAGIAVAFGAPIGGVLFTLEQVTYHSNERVMWHSFVCAVIAAVTLEVLNPFRTGKSVYFQVTFDRNWHDFELLAFAVIGVTGGIYGSMLIKLNRWFAEWRRTHITRPLFEVTCVAAFTALISYPDIYMRLQSQVLLSNLFEECTDKSLGDLCNMEHWFSTVALLLIAAAVGFVFTAYSFGMSIPAGVLMPSMLIGAIGGRSIGVFMSKVHSAAPDLFLFRSCPPDGTCVTPGVYALVGAASALTGVTRLTVSCVVIMFELTGALTYVLPIMSGVIVSKWIADSFGRMSIYDSWIEISQYPLLGKLDDGAVPDSRVTTSMTRLSHLKCVSLDMTMEQAKLLPEYRGYPVIQSKSNPVLLGYVARRDLKSLPDGIVGATFHEWAETSPMTIQQESTLYHALTLFQSLGLRYLCITHHGKLCGLLTRRDMWRLLGTVERRAELNDDLFKDRRPSDGITM